MVKGRKVLVIGLDGETYRVIRPLVDQGKMPILRGLMEKGSHGVLLSTVPPVTAPAWSTFMTGKNPGKHGVYSFIRFDYSKGRAVCYERELGYPVNSLAIQGKTIWEILGEAGKRVISINIPMTYPPRKVNGLMVSCFFTPPGATDFTYPPELADELRDYEIDVDFGYGFGQFGQLDAKTFDPSAIVPAFERLMTKRGEHALRLIRKYPWDFCAVCFTETDRLHHLLWKYLDPEAPDYSSPASRSIRESYEGFYARLDRMMGELVQEAGEQAVTLVMSDHGFRASPGKLVSLNQWLHENGFLSRRGNGVAPESRGPGDREMPENRETWFEKLLGKLSPRGKKGNGEVRPQPPIPVMIDWSATRAWAEPLLIGVVGIRVNRMGVMPDGCVSSEEYEELRSQLLDRLSSFVDPETGKRLVVSARRREDVYRGGYADSAPDIIVKLDPAYDTPLHLTTGMEQGKVLMPAWENLLCGTHEEEGIYLFSGGPTRTISRMGETYSLEDIAPTLLYLMGVPVPEDMDGSVLQGIISEDFLKAHPVAYQKVVEEKVSVSDRRDSGWSSDEDAERIKDRLRNLGYL